MPPTNLSNVMIMQRIKALIEKLNTQFEQNASVVEMLTTLQLLQRELAGGLKETQILGASNVSVVIPHAPSIKYQKAVERVSEVEKIYFELPATDASDEEIDELILENNKIEAAKFAERKSGEDLANKESDPKKVSWQTEMLFAENEGYISEVPTFAQYSKHDEEVVNVQQNVKNENAQPVKHLKKIISDLDRQFFLQNLFRGDEAMYERSIKTIDNFYAFPEAEFWIRRELKTKLGWLPDDPTVDHFDRLVKRRFA